MKVTHYEITDPEAFEKEVDSLTINLRTAGSYLVGDVIINDNCITGEHDYCDYDFLYGFMIVSNKDDIKSGRSKLRGNVIYNT